MHRNKETNKNVDINNLFKIYHQNIRGFRSKNKRIHVFVTLEDTAHYLTEHHLKDYKIDITPITKYKLCVNIAERI